MINLDTWGSLISMNISREVGEEEGTSFYN